ncbi:hypothetical protein BsWGS_18651 [Bradybaena similaris]
MSVMNISLPSNLLEVNSLHFPRTTVITLYGPGAVGMANSSWLTSVLYGPGGIPVGAIDELYRFQNPTRWYFRASDKMSQNTYEGLHGMRIKVPDTDICLELEHVEKERTRITVHWMPVTYPLEAVKIVVEAITGDSDAEVLRLRNQQGRWGVLCRPTKVIPHFALVEVPGRRDEWHRIKITVQGRPTECQVCGDTEHRTNKCLNRSNRMRQSHEPSLADFPPLLGQDAQATTAAPVGEKHQPAAATLKANEVVKAAEMPQPAEVPEMPEAAAGKERKVPATTAKKA